MFIDHSKTGAALHPKMLTQLHLLFVTVSNQTIIT